MDMIGWRIYQVMCVEKFVRGIQYSVMVTSTDLLNWLKLVRENRDSRAARVPTRNNMSPRGRAGPRAKRDLLL